jgi:hypothetical protein
MLAFKGIRLNPDEFPTAAALNSDSSRRTPLELEKRFEEHVGRDVPDDYLHQVETFFKELHEVLRRTRFELYHKQEVFLQSYTPVFVVNMSVVSEEHCVHLGMLAVRPCAEGFGFARLLLHELWRNCVHFNFDLCVDYALPYLRHILVKALPERKGFFMQPLELGWSQLGDATRRLGVERLFVYLPAAPSPPQELEDGRQLDDSQFPPAREMNTGVGPLIEARTKKWLEPKPPSTGAYLVPEMRHTFRNQDSHRVMGTPAVLESQFALYVGANIPDNYLWRVEGFFRHLHKAGEAILSLSDKLRDARCVYKLTVYTPVFVAGVHIETSSTPKLRSVTLTYIAIRQCAEGFGFCRLLLYELARICVRFQANLKVKEALEGTRAILQRSFAGKVPRGAVNYNISYEDLTDPAQQLGVQHLLLEQPEASSSSSTGKRKLSESDLVSSSLEPANGFAVALEPVARI